MKTNKFGKIGLDYLKACSKLKRTKGSGFATRSLAPVLAILPGICIQPDSVLEVLTPAAVGIGDTSVAYARAKDIAPLEEFLKTNKTFKRHYSEIANYRCPLPRHLLGEFVAPHIKNNKYPGYSDIFSAISFDWSEEGIWSRALLHELRRNLPLFDHANYNKVSYILDIDEYPKIAHINNSQADDTYSRYKIIDSDDCSKTILQSDDYPEEDYKIAQSLRDKEELLPSVKIVSPNFAKAKFLCWSEWGGLFEKTLTIKQTDNGLNAAESLKHLVRYSCRVRF